MWGAGSIGWAVSVAASAHALYCWCPCEPTNCSSFSTINSAPLRAGQTQPTRVVRLLAEDTVDACLLDVQRRKLESGEVAVAGSEGPTLAEADAGMLLSVYEAIK